MVITDEFPGHLGTVVVLAYAASLSKTWAARLTGVGGKYGFQRQFCQKVGSSLRSDGNTGEVYLQLDGDGVYESLSCGKRQFWLLNGGKLSEINRFTAIELLGGSAEPAVPAEPKDRRKRRQRDPNQPELYPDVPMRWFIDLDPEEREQDKVGFLVIFDAAYSRSDRLIHYRAAMVRDDYEKVKTEIHDGKVSLLDDLSVVMDLPKVWHRQGLEIGAPMNGHRMLSCLASWRSHLESLVREGLEHQRERDPDEAPAPVPCCTKTVAELAAMCGLGLKSVREALVELVGMGVLVANERPGYATAYQLSVMTEYQLSRVQLPGDLLAIPSGLAMNHKWMAVFAAVQQALAEEAEEETTR